MEFMAPTFPGAAGVGQQANPWFTVANQFVPRNLHEVIKWARYITLQSPTTSEVIRKLATYPITDFLIDTEQEGTRKRYEHVFKSFRLKEALQDAGFEFFTIGNVFVSIYFPIHRELECPGCKTKHNAKNAHWATFKQWGFHGECPLCKYKGVFTRTDTKSVSIDDMNLIKWTPEHIAVNHNPITGESEYYYKIPNIIKQRIQRGDKLFINSIPWAFVEAVRFNQDFKFDRGSLFHLKNVSSGGTVEGIAIPPLLSLFSLVFYQATLRKANEAIATEYLNPLRVVFPQAQTANSDPAVSMSMRNFRSNMEDALRRHKQDKNHIVIAPMPVGYQPLGGDGKNLLVAQEIQQAEQSILLSLGVSQELLSGTTNWTSSSVGLRMMENLLTSYIGRLQELIDWIVERVAAYLTMEKVPVSLVPFKLLDDDNLKNLLVQLAMPVQQGVEPKISDKTLFEELGIDFNEELERKKEQAVTMARHQIETEYEVGEAHFVAARSTGEKMSENEQYQNLLAEAQMIAEPLFQADEATQRQMLGQLKIAEYSMYVMVKHLLEEAQNSAMNQAQMDQVQNEAAAAAPQEQGAEGGDGSAPPKPGKNDKPKGPKE
jgi:hypothetical protein